MRIIISPAKKMVVDTDTFSCKEVPCFMEKTQILKDWICGLSYAEQKALWKCNDKIAQQNAERFAQMDLYRNLTPALLAYDRRCLKTASWTTCSGICTFSLDSMASSCPWTAWLPTDWRCRPGLL